MSFNLKQKKLGGIAVPAKLNHLQL